KDVGKPKRVGGRLTMEMAPSLIGAALGGYRVIAPLGVGGMGAVYLAEAPLLGRRVAGKGLHPELARAVAAAARCFGEARGARALARPRIGRVLECVSTGAFAYLVLEHLGGRTLAEVLDDDGPLGVAAALNVAEQIAEALEATHARGLVHGALKSEN